MSKRNREQDAREEREEIEKAARLAAYGDKIEDPDEREEAERAARANGHDELRETLAALGE